MILLKKKENQRKTMPLIKREMFIPEFKQENREIKPELKVTISQENDYAVIRPIEEKNNQKPIQTIKPEEIKKEIQPEQKPKLESPKEIKPIEEKKIEKIEESIKTIKEEEAKTTDRLIDMVETDIDKLMRILNQKKSVSIGDLSRELRVTIERLENWAKILEEHGLIQIEYPIIGLPKLRKREWKEES
jgi:DNA-binding transcriptional ArsR family regulator